MFHGCGFMVGVPLYAVACLESLSFCVDSAFIHSILADSDCFYLFLFFG